MILHREIRVTGDDEIRENRNVASYNMEGFCSYILNLKTLCEQNPSRQQTNFLWKINVHSDSE